MARPKREAVTDTSVLDIVAPSLDNRLDDIAKATQKLANKWGLDDAVAIPGKDLERFRRRVYSTGMLSLDKLLKIGGLPRGHIVELFGSPHAGKSLLLYHIIRQVQYTCISCEGELEYFDLMKGGKPVYMEVDMLVKGIPTPVKIKKRSATCKSCQKEDTGGLFVLFDQENSFDPIWTEQQGVELTKMLVLKLPTGEHAIDMLRMIMNQHKPDGIGIDSIAQLQPKTEQERSAVDDAVMMGLHAKIMSQLCRHVTSSFLEDPKRAPLFVWVNQMRADTSGNNALKVTGGFAPEFYSSIRIYMLRRGLVNQQHPELGTNGRITIKKCKAAKGVTNRTVDYILLDSGFDMAKDIYETAVASDIFLTSALGSGGHFWADDTNKENKLAASRQAALEMVYQDPAFAAELRRRVLAQADQPVLSEVYVGDFTQQEEESGE